MERKIPNLDYEQNLKIRGYQFIAGVDEAGRGPWAGPVVAAAVILPDNYCLPGLNDSKKLSAKQRERLFYQIRADSIALKVGIVDHQTIDQINILQATYYAMREAVNGLEVTPDYLLVDAVQIPGIRIPQLPIIRGDSQSISIAAASIIAKVTRDFLMQLFDMVYPQYGFAQHKGYGTAKHLTALMQYGISPIHRRTFQPVRQLFTERG